MLKVPDLGETYFFGSGSKEAPPLFVRSSRSTEVTVGLSFLSARGGYLFKDFSLVVWGRGGGRVTITHEAGLRSDHFINIEPDSSVKAYFMQDLA